jgi:hypothetical protein
MGNRVTRRWGCRFDDKQRQEQFLWQEESPYSMAMPTAALMIQAAAVLHLS